MSIKLMTSVFDSSLPSTEKFVLLAMADYASDDGQSIYPSIKTLSQKTSFSERTVQDTIKSLIEKKLLELVKEGGGRNNTNLYKIRCDNFTLYQIPDQEKGATGSEKGADGSIKGATGSEKGAAPAPDPSLTVNNPSFNPITPTVKKTSLEDIKKWQEEKRQDPMMQSWAKYGVTFAPNDDHLIFEYPPDTQNWLREFIRLWPLDIPNSNKAQKGMYGNWIGGLRAMAVASAEFGIAILQPVYDDWEKSRFSVSHPGALIKVINAKVAELRIARKQIIPESEITYVDGVYEGDHSNVTFQEWQEKRKLEKENAKSDL